MDLEQLTTVNIKTDEVKEISQACTKLTSQNKKVEDLQNLLKEEQEEARRLSEEVIPTLMQQAGVSSIKLEDGSSVTVSPYYYAKIPEDKKHDAYSWLRDNNFGDLIKNNVSANSIFRTLPFLSSSRLTSKRVHQSLLAGSPRTFGRKQGAHDRSTSP